MIKKITVLGKDYKIVKKLPKKLSEKVTQEELNTYYGLCFMEEGLIWIHPKLTNEHFYRTLFHETGHATMYRNGVRFSGMIPMELEEILVETFASKEYETMKALIKEVLKHEDSELRDRLQSLIRD